ncbi:MAG: sarcosine oxidase subunit delta [Chloroflexi bacterium]|nr:sarcosine oxidase subunit delta [Chloroflexota bacterium]
MIQIDCPNCGMRNVAEFRHGGEYNPRPKGMMDISNEEWTNYIFLRENKVGVQKEWWYHRAGCGIWFLGERHTKSNVVEKTYYWER